MRMNDTLTSSRNTRGVSGREQEDRQRQMKNIILTAENFAFGPIGKLLTVAEKIDQRKYSLTFVGYGTAYQLAKMSSIRNAVEINTDSDESLLSARQLFENADLVISCMDWASVRLAQSLGKPTIWLDTLFWMWDEIPDNILEVDIYIKQNSLNDAENLRRYGKRIRNLRSVGPIVDLDPLQYRSFRNQAVVTYGGMEGYGWFEVGKDSNYPYTMTELLIREVNLSGFDRVLFTGNERIIRELDAEYRSDKLIFETLPHSQFVRELASSRLALMAPGLESPLEAFAYQIPTIFLPPSNSSQYHQLDDFGRYGAANMAIHFRDYYPELDLTEKNLREQMRMFLEQLRIFENDKEALAEVASRIGAFMADRELQAIQVEGQKAYLRRIGENGLESVLEVIHSFLEN